MVLGTLLLISLLECFSFQVKIKVKLLPDIDPKEGNIISRKWEHSIPQGNCSLSGWEISDGKAATCSVGSSISENCTLVSPDYNVTKADELFINITAETRNCTYLSKDKICEENFSLLAFYRDSKKQKTIKKFLGPIPASPLTTSRSSSGQFFKTKNVISFSRDKRYSHVKLGFQESSYCGTVGPVSIFYYECPAETSKLVDFEDASAPSKLASPKIITGKCTNDAVPEIYPLNMKCYYNGTFVVFGSCKCKAGFKKAHSKCQG